MPKTASFCTRIGPVRDVLVKYFEKRAYAVVSLPANMKVWISCEVECSTSVSQKPYWRVQNTTYEPKSRNRTFSAGASNLLPCSLVLGPYGSSVQIHFRCISRILTEGAQQISPGHLTRLDLLVSAHISSHRHSLFLDEFGSYPVQDRHRVLGSHFVFCFIECELMGNTSGLEGAIRNQKGD